MSKETELEVPTQAALLRRLYKRTKVFIDWLEVVQRADCRHVGFENAAKAEEAIELLAKENDQTLKTLERLASLAPKENQ